MWPLIAGAAAAALPIAARVATAVAPTAIRMAAGAALKTGVSHAVGGGNRGNDGEPRRGNFDAGAQPQDSMSSAWLNTPRW